MEYLNLTDLHNPNKIMGVWHSMKGVIMSTKNQSFQEYPKTIELWEKLDDGRLLRVDRYFKKSLAWNMINGEWFEPISY